MAAKKSPADALTSATSAALAGDPTLRDSTREVFDDALNHAKYILAFGDTSEKASLIKAIVPQMMRSLQDEQADAKKAAQRAVYARMREALAGRSAPTSPESIPPKGDEVPLGGTPRRSRKAAS